MASLSYRQLQIVEDYLGQIHHAILDLKEWNKGIDSPDTWLMSADGMKTLAANCMLLEAIGEGFKKVDVLTKKQLLPSRPEIPWKQVMGMRDHIAHGYFDINSDLVWDTIQNDLSPLQEAVEFLIKRKRHFLFTLSPFFFPSVSKQASSILINPLFLQKLLPTFLAFLFFPYFCPCKRSAPYAVRAQTLWAY